MKHNQSLLQGCDALFETLLLDILKKLLLDPERPAGKRNLRLPPAGDFIDLGTEIVHHMTGVRRRADGGNGANFRDIAGSGKHGCAAETVSDKDLRRLVIFAQESQRPSADRRHWMRNWYWRIRRRWRRAR